MKKALILFPLLALAISGCANQTKPSSEQKENDTSNAVVESSEIPTTSEHKHSFDTIRVKRDAYKRTYLVGQDFETNGLLIQGICSSCRYGGFIEYTVENGQDLQLGQESVTIIAEDGTTFGYQIKVVEKYHIACVGDSLTAGHYWASESYPTKLGGLVDAETCEVGNFGVNGISITGYGGSWDDPEMRYIKQDVYTNSVNFNPDVFAIMLGTNDATGWANAEATFDEYYHILLDSYIEQFPCASFIMMVSPPTKDGNQFGIPNDIINDEINPRQRDLADEYGFELLDLREEFEAVSDYESRYLRPNNDGVHFTVEAAEYVAGRVWDIVQDLYF